VPALTDKVAIPGYEILGELGRGGMGVVYRARQLGLNRVVALKMILGGPHAGSEGLRRFRLEAEAVALLVHPHIVQIHEIGDCQGLPWFSLEFVAGGSLADRLDGTPWPAARAAGLVETLARAIHAAHQLGIVHRDLKPANVLLTADNTPKISDFGLAKKVADAGQTQSGAVVGTPSYMAPEQAEGLNRQVGPATDVYALGTILYELVTGRPPFRAATALETLLQVAADEPVPPRALQPSLPRDLQTICLKCLEKTPVRRYATSADLAEDLRRFQAGEPIAARPARALERTLKWVRRRPALAGLLLVAALALLGLAGGGFWFTLQLKSERDRAVQAEAQTRQERDRALDANRQRVRAQVEQLCLVPPQAVPAILATLQSDWDAVLPRLRELWADRAGDRKQRMRAGLALLAVEPEVVGEEPLAWLLEADDPAEVLLVRDVLAPHKDAWRERLWAQAEAAKLPSARFNALAALAAFDPEGARWEKHAATATELLLSANTLHLGTWVEGLRPARAQLLKPLGAVFRSAPVADRRQVSAQVLATYAGDRPEVLADLLANADREQLAVVFPKLRQHASAAELLGGELRRMPGAGAREPERVALAQRQANAGAALLLLGQAEPVWHLLRHSADPTRRSYLVQRLALLGVDAGLLVKRLEAEPDVTARRALVLALGEYGPEQLPAEVRGPLTAKLLDWYRHHPDAGLHAAIDWLLRPGREGPEPRKLSWGQAAALRQIDEDLKGVAPPAGQRWSVNPAGLTLALFPGPSTFRMGSPTDEPGRANHEQQHQRRISRSFALATKPVTVEQFGRFVKAHPEVRHNVNRMYSPSPDGPIIAVTWYQAAAYCRWLSEDEKLAEEQMCFPPIAEIMKCADGVTPLKLPGNYLSRTGYRLPTKAEMEYACRADTTSSRYYGGGVDLLPRYGWYLQNSQRRAWPVGHKRPNDFGLFDMLGNVACWGMESSGDAHATRGVTEDREEKGAVSDRSVRTLRGGSWAAIADDLRSAFRTVLRPSYVNESIGFRPARTLP
jgi:formylglycine-generating enzyme required for sulfatase activity